MTDAAALGPERVDKRRLSLEAIKESKLGQALIGVGVAAVFFIIIFFIWEGFLGHLTSVTKVNSTLPLGSNAVTVGAPVEYNYVTVGKIDGEGRAPNGAVIARLALYPSLMKQVPSNVQAQVEPESIFGNQEVALIVPGGVSHASPRPLSAGDSIPPYTASPSTSLQGSVTTIYDLLKAVRPADLMTALDAVSTALKGEGTALGQSLVAGSNYLGAIDPHLQTIAADVQLLTPVSNEFNAATPNTLSVLSNSAVTAQTITADAIQVRDLLSEGAQATGQLNAVLQQVRDTLPQLLNQSGPLLSDINRNPNELAETLSGLGQWAAAWAAAESNGPYISVNANLPLANVNDAVDAALGYGLPGSLAGAIGPAHFNPPTYTAADCPNYGLPNPYCGAGGSPAAQPVGAASVGGSGSSTTSGSSDRAASTGGSAPAGSTVVAGAGAQPLSPYAEAQQAAEAIATALNGGQPTPEPAVATMLLLPLLASMSAGSR